VEVVEDSKIVTLPDEHATLPAFAKRYWLLAYEASGKQADEVTHTYLHADVLMKSLFIVTCLAACLSVAGEMARWLYVFAQ